MERLGRYLLERKLATGGMAEIFLARQTGPGGFERACVVKRMLSHHAQEPGYVEMFLDEARLGARLAHPGIAHIYDFGLEAGTYFIAMEHITGAPLTTVLQIHRQQRQQVPIAAALRVVSLVASTLDHAHRATDERGHPLDLIHRDVTPHNIMISKLGEVKLIDFGIAKASNARHRTAVGTMKGKIGYMSPEQLRQQPLDGRSDVYSLGLVLYELLAGVPAIRGDSHAALLNAAAKRQITSLAVLRPEVEAGVRAIVDSALAVEPSQRIGAAELSDRLEDALARTGTKVKPADVAALLHLELTTAATNPGVGNAASARDATTIEKNPGPPIIDQAPLIEELVPIDEEAPDTLDHPQPKAAARATLDARLQPDERERPTTRVEEPAPVALADPQASISTNPRFLAEAPLADSGSSPIIDVGAIPVADTGPARAIPAATQVVPPKRRRLRRAFVVLLLLSLMGLAFPDAWVRFAPPETQQQLREMGFAPEPVWPWLRSEGARWWSRAMDAVGG